MLICLLEWLDVMYVKSVLFIDMLINLVFNVVCLVKCATQGSKSTIDEISIENYCCAAYCCCCCLEFFRVHGGILQKYFVYCWIQVMCMMYNIEFYGTDV